MEEIALIMEDIAPIMEVSIQIMEETALIMEASVQIMEASVQIMEEIALTMEDIALTMEDLVQIMEDLLTLIVAQLEEIVPCLGAKPHQVSDAALENVRVPWEAVTAPATRTARGGWSAAPTTAGSFIQTLTRRWTAAPSRRSNKTNKKKSTFIFISF